MIKDEEFKTFKNHLIEIFNMYADFERRSQLIASSSPFDKAKKAKLKIDTTLIMDTNQSII